MSNIGTSNPFIHLRLHSSYSLLEGAIRPEELPLLCKEASMPAVAITDSGNLFGALEISELLIKGGIQPLIGCEFKLKLSINNQEKFKDSDVYDIALLAQNERGYLNLLKFQNLLYLFFLFLFFL